MVPQMSSKFDVGRQIGPSGGPTAYIPQSMQIDQTMDLQGIGILWEYVNFQGKMPGIHSSEDLHRTVVRGISDHCPATHCPN